MQMQGWAAATALAFGFAIALLRVPFSRFDAEDITVEVSAQRIEVTGVYHYRNDLPFPIRQSLEIPLPHDDGEPDAYALSVTSDGDTVRLTRALGTYRCDVELPARGSRTVRLRYSQYAPLSRGTYLLRTTKPWRRPIEHGTYRLIARAGSTITSSNYPLSFTRTNFMPESDWRFTWR